MSSDEQEIRELVSKWMEATKLGDVESVLSLMSDDVIFLVPGRDVMRKKEFEAVMRTSASAPAVQMDATSEIQEIQLLGDWAFMWTRLKIVITPPGDLPPVRRAGHTLSVLQKVSGKWVLARDANLLATVSN